MLIGHYQKYLKPNFKLRIKKQVGDRIKTGYLDSGSRQYTVRNFIPRFCEESTYADSFGYQWNKFKASQMNKSGKILSFARFCTFTKWNMHELRGKNVLEVGCGAGRFTEILLEAGAKVVSFDLSAAVDACYEQNQNPRLFVFQGDLFDLPVAEENFDFIFCFGVLQHTPHPIKAFQTLVRYLKKGGRISADNYIFRLFSPGCTPKYVWRWLTKRMKPETLLKIIEIYVPLYLPLDTLIKRIPVIGNGLSALIPIPCYNYVHLNLNDKVRLEWAVLDTLDALSAKHDHPMKIKDFELACMKSGLKEFEVFLGSNGLVVNAIR